MKTHENVGVFQALCRAICRPLGFSYTRDNRQLNFNDTDVGVLQPVPRFAGFAGVVEITRLNTSEFLHYLDELYGNELVFAFSFVSSNNTDVETTEQFILLHTRYVCDFSGLNNFSQKL